MQRGGKVPSLNEVLKVKSASKSILEYTGDIVKMKAKDNRTMIDKSLAMVVICELSW